jgi:molybdenum cofactor synthesis domain-containing protein
LILEITSAIITISDKGAKGERKDESGLIIAEMLEATGYEVAQQMIIPDDRRQIEEALVNLSDNQKIDLIITTGGTGFAHRDITPEATMAVAQRIAPGIAEAMRAHSMQITKRAMLSRGVSVIRGSTLIINLPGSPKAVKESLEFILPNLPHGIEILKGEATDCAETGEKH